MANKPSPNALADGQVEIWKKVVEVQQHFNDLELRIRNFALAVSGAFLGLGGYAIKDGGFTTLFGLKISVAGIVVLTSVFPLLAFYFMDRLWYHRLLEGSVSAGIKAETALQGLGYTVDLGSEIKAKSPFWMWFFGWRNVRSKHKMDLFYLLLLISLLIVAGVLGFGLKDQQAEQDRTDGWTIHLQRNETPPRPVAGASRGEIPKRVAPPAAPISPQPALSNEAATR